MLAVDSRIRVPLRELRFTFSTSSGPGGQNVNRVRTKATLRWDVVATKSLPPDVRERFVARQHRRIAASGELVLTSQRFRDQGRNVADCLEKLRGMLLEVASPPKRRRTTTPRPGARERRLATKKHRSGVKATRRRPSRDD